MAQVTIALGGREWTIQRKPYGNHLKARQRIKKSTVMLVLESLSGIVDELKAIINSVPDGGGWSDIDLGRALAIAPVLPMMVNGLLNSVDEVADLLFEYDPKLAAERKWIEAHAYDEEIIAAFMEVLKLLFPITALWAMVNGSRAQETSKNSHSQNGASPLPAEGPKKGNRKPIPSPAS